MLNLPPPPPPTNITGPITTTFTQLNLFLKLTPYWGHIGHRGRISAPCEGRLTIHCVHVNRCHTPFGFANSLETAWTKITEFTAHIFGYISCSQLVLTYPSTPPKYTPSLELILTILRQLLPVSCAK